MVTFVKGLCLEGRDFNVTLSCQEQYSKLFPAEENSHLNTLFSAILFSFHLELQLHALYCL